MNGAWCVFEVVVVNANLDPVHLQHTTVPPHHMRITSLKDGPLQTLANIHNVHIPSAAPSVLSLSVNFVVVGLIA